MTWWQACLWGVLGAGLVEAVEMWQLYHTEGRFPWTKDGEPQAKPYLVAFSLRLFMAGGINAAYASSGQVAGPLAAVTLGITAPLIIQWIADTRPSQQTGSDPSPNGTVSLTASATSPALPKPAAAPEEQAAQQPHPAPDPGRSHDGR